MKTKIRELRRSQGLAVNVLAHKARVSTSTVILWERYGLPPRRRATVEKIARVLGVDADTLLTDAHTTDGGEQA